MRRFPWVTLGVVLSLGCQKRAAEDRRATSTPSASVVAATPIAPPAASGDSEAVPRADEMNLPAGLGKLKVPADNPQTQAKIDLGQRLFFDPRLSSDGSRSCYSCHRNEDGTGGHDATALGVGDKKLSRHSPALFNSGYLPRLGWDGRYGSLEELATALFTDGSMGNSSTLLAKKAAELAKIAGYKTAFDAAFPAKGATPESVVQALAAYQRAIVCDDTDYDRFAQGNRNALSAPQKHGLELFMGKAGCVACHTPPFFSSAFIVRDGTYFNVGVGFAEKAPEAVDPGRNGVTKSDADFGAFKVPSLRHVSKSAPYFHDGSKRTLADAVRYMASGGTKNERLTPLMTDKQLADAEVEAIVDFLGALDCKVALAEPPAPRL